MTVHLTEQAITRFREYEPPEGYYLAFSGGKDSIVIYDLAIRSGVRFDAHFHATTVDPPEVLQFIKKHYSKVSWEKPKNSMFKLIVKHRILPTRAIRYCCRALKEIGGKNRLIVTGIRWAESAKRRKRQMYEQSRHNKKTWFLHPIIDWTDQDVWDYIRSESLAYCSLYDEGQTRIGCIMCPMQGTRGMLLDAERYPKYYKAYLITFGKMLDAIRANGRVFKHGSTPEEVMYWWIYGKDLDTATVQKVLKEDGHV
ncbi:Phosphoadenosine phosphosulfate reductase [subsurface metagenome]